MLANARAAHRGGALVASYATVRSFEKADGQIRGAVVEDSLEGRRFTIHARVIVNAGGPWTDAVRQLDESGAQPLLRPTKGVHVAVPRHRVGNVGALTITSPIDGRVMFILPSDDSTIIGTTDSDYAGDPAAVVPTAEDVIYLLRSANALFPDARLAARDVRAAWAGLRPLLKDGSEGSTAAVPREHRISESAAGLLTIAGGKLTTYRAMAAELVDVVAGKLHRIDGRPVPARAPTAVEPLPGGDVADLDLLVRELTKERVSPEIARHLVDTYGSEAMGVANLAARDSTLAEPLAPGVLILRAEVVHQARREMAVSVGDVMIRRTRLFHQHPGQGTEVTPVVAGLLARELSWDAAREAASLASYLAEVQRMRQALTPASAS